MCAFYGYACTPTSKLTINLEIRSAGFLGQLFLKDDCFSENTGIIVAAADAVADDVSSIENVGCEGAFVAATDKQHSH